MAPRRSGVHSLLNSEGYGSRSEPNASPHCSNDSYISSPRSRSDSGLSATSPRRLRSPVAFQTETFGETGLDAKLSPASQALHHPSTAQRQAMPLNTAQLPRKPPNTPSGYSPFAQTADDKLMVSIDTYSASREAGGKRQKNADASARYRRRKADQAAEEKSRVAQLEEENRYLGGRVIELTRQKEFYREERRALRDIMMAVPGLQQAARNRPDSPRPSLEAE